jgi:LysM repeat protein
MRWRLLLIASLLMNLVLAGCLLLYARRVEARFRGVADNLRQPILTNRQPARVIVRRQFFSWREVESPDYPSYIANLRDIGCPESTIRDIIVADVNQLYALKRATEIVTTEQQWWRSEPDEEVAKAAELKLRALDDERRALLTRLLGPNWDLDDAAALVLAVGRPHAALPLDGPVLGLLSLETKQKVRDLVFGQQQKVQAYLETMQQEGRTPDPAELARIRQQTRDELTAILSPPQLEEFLLRFAENSQSLREELGGLRYFNATPDEFRSIFRATDGFDQEIKLKYSGDDTASAQGRAALEQQREQAIKNILGPQRYEQYRLLHDPLYRDAVAAATKAGTPNAVGVFYQIAQETAVEEALVNADPSLTPAQREIRLKEIELEQMKAHLQATGEHVPTEKPAPQPAAPRVLHVIQSGDTLERLAAAYGTTVQDIVAANGNRDVMRLRPGDPLYLPTPVAAPPAGL